MRATERRSEISERIKAVAEFIAYPYIADIGCDHAYISIHALLTGRAEKAVACDINEGPLARAAENIARYGLGDKITIRKGCGMGPLKQAFVDTAVIAGMGGHLIADILNESRDTAKALKQLVLQPMSEVRRVREYIHLLGFIIADEKMVFEDGKYYYILDCRPGSEAGYTEAEYELGRALLNKRPDVFIRFLEYEEAKIRAAVARIDAGRPCEGRTHARRSFLSDRLLMLREIIDDGKDIEASENMEGKEFFSGGGGA